MLVPTPTTQLVRERDLGLGRLPGPVVLATAPSGTALWVAGGGRGEAVVMRHAMGVWTHHEVAANGLRSILAIDDATAVISGERGFLAYTSDGGTTWTTVASGTSGCLYALSRDDQGAIWVGGDSRVVLRSTDRGASFARVDPPGLAKAIQGRVLRVVPRAQNEQWLLTAATLARVGADDGARRILECAPVMNDVAEHEGSVIVVGDRGAAWRSSDGGTRFEPLDLGTTADLDQIRVIDDALVVLCGDGAVRISDDDGTTWTTHAIWDDLAVTSLVEYSGGWVVGGWRQSGPPYQFDGALAYLGPPERAPIIVAQRPNLARPRANLRTIAVPDHGLGATEFRVITAADADARFGLAGRFEMPYDAMTQRHTIRLYEGDVVVDAFDSPNVGDGSHNVIVDGTLYVRGVLRWSDYAGGSFLYATRAISVACAELQGCATLATPLFEAEHVIACHHGDNGGYLQVGTMRATLVVQDTYFNVTADTIEAVVIGDSYRVSPRVDHPRGDAPKLLRPDVLDAETGTADSFALVTAAAAGRACFRDDLD